MLQVMWCAAKNCCWYASEVNCAVAIGVEDNPRLVRPLPHRHQQGFDQQLVTLPEYMSSPMQRYSQCSVVRTYVMSVAPLVLGDVVWKSCSR